MSDYRTFRWLRAAAILCFLPLPFYFTTKSLYASDPCNPPNVIAQPVCDMDSFYGDPPQQLPDGWASFVIYGEPTFMNEPHSLFGSGTLRIWSNGGTFKAGIYTQVAVTAGTGYRASVAWAAPNAPDAFSRQLGIDPTGGTDPASSNIIWGPVHVGEGRMLNYANGEGPNIDVKARAVNGTISVFFVTDHPYSTGDNLIYVDAIALYADENVPSAQAPAPTPTPVPATLPPPTLAPPLAAPPVADQPVAIPQVPVPQAPIIEQNTTQSRQKEGLVAAADAGNVLRIIPPPPLDSPDTPTPVPLPSDTLLPVQEQAGQEMVQEVVADTTTNTIALAAAPMPAVDTPAPTYTPLPTPTWTPWPVSHASRSSFVQNTFIQNSFIQDRLSQFPNTASSRALSLLSAFSFSGALVFGSAVWWMRRRGR